LESTVTATTAIDQLKNETPAVQPAVWPVAAGVPALLIEGVSKRFVVGRAKKPVAAITNVSMRLERGDIHGILGANGSGKSTLIRLISGLLTLDEGRVEVFGSASTPPSSRSSARWRT
jgi:ABC-type multidrug transport system ATPase subunit